MTLLTHVCPRIWRLPARSTILPALLGLLLACSHQAGGGTGTSSGTGGTATGGSSGGTTSGGNTDAGSGLDAGSCADAGCPSDQYCASGGCAQKLSVGSCGYLPGLHTANEVCKSGLCLGGACCASATCPAPDSECGSCSLTTGACGYLGAGTVCGAAGCDAGVLVAAATCDGLGTCRPGVATPCDPFACDPQGPSCLTSCIGPAGCSKSSYCTGEDISGDAGICCDNPGLQMYADSQLGADQGCCGTPTRPCRSLGEVISRILILGQSGLTIVATVDGGAGDWSGNEGSVTLSFGMTLHAPGVRFPATSVVQFAARSSGPSDHGPIAIEGDEASSAYVDIEGPVDDLDPTFGVPLNLSWARLGVILSVGPAADVVAKPAAGGGPSVILAGAQPGYGGLFCLGNALRPAKFSGAISVSTFTTDVTVGDDCTASFTASQIGPAVQDGGCPSQDDTGISTVGNGSIALLAGTALSCIVLDGVDLASGTSPTFTAQGASISNCGSAGLRVSGGTATISGTTITGNAYGVVQETGGSFAVDATGAESTIACNTEVGIWNHSATSASATHTRWNQKIPTILTCSDQFVTCSCSTDGGCGAAPYPGVDVAITPDATGDAGTVDVSYSDPSPALCN